MATGETALRVRGLQKRYAGREVLRGLDLDVRRGDIYGFLGANGAGKTTTIRCILGLTHADAGEVAIFGQTDATRRRVGVGAIVETPAFHGWRSARDNLRLAAAWIGASDEAAIEAALLRVGLQERGDEAVAGYSLGMKQRLGIARCLLGRPRLLVLDEPTNGLDPRGMREVRDLIVDLVRRDGMTVVVSSHLLADLQLFCTRVGILDGGRIVAEGGVDELVRGAGAQDLDLGVDDVGAARRVLDTLQGVSVVGDGSELRLRVRLSGVEPRALVRALVTAGVGVDAVVPRRSSLEDVFLATTSGGAP